MPDKLTQNTTSGKIEETLTGILAMEHLQKKADYLILDMKRKEEKLSLLQRSLDDEKLKLNGKIRKDKKTQF